MNIIKNIDTNTLEQLPVAVILFDNKKIYYLNKKAIDLFSINKAKLKNIQQLSVFNFIHQRYHARLTKNNLLILKGQEFPPIELECTDFKNNIVFVEAKSNAVFYQGKKVVQSTFLEINDRIKKVSELENTKYLLSNISKSINEVIYELAFFPEPHIKYISDSVYNVLGRKPAEIYKNPNIFFNQIHDDDKQKHVSNLTNYLKVSNNTQKEKEVFRFFHKNGKLLLLETFAKPIFNQENKIISIIGVIRDITKEKNYQIELEQKWNNYKNLIDTSVIGIFIHHEGKCLYCNKTAANILEVSNPEKLFGKNLVQYIVPELREREKKRIKLAEEGAELHNLEYTIKTEKGNIINVELKTVPFIYNGIKCVQTIISNLSAEKKLARETLRAELAEEGNKKLLNEIEFRKKIQQELVIQTSKYEAIFNDTSHLIWTVNNKYEITSFNKNYQNYFKRLYNYNIKINENIKIISSKHYQSNINFWIKKYDSFFKSNNSKSVDFFEVENTTQKGEVFYRQVFLHPIKNASGKTTEIAIIAQDVTERKLTEQKISQQTAKLKAIFESGKQLIWTVDRNFHFTSFNNNFANSMYALYKAKPTINNKIYFPNKTHEGKLYHQFWLNKYQEVFETSKSVEFTTEQKDKKGNIIYRQIFLHPIFDNNNKVIEISCLSNDTTELNYLQNQSINQAAKLNSIFESSNHLIWTIDVNFKATSFNKNFADTFYLNYKNHPKLNTQLHLCLPKNEQKNYQSYWYELYKQALKGNSLKFERKQITTNGDFNYKEVFLNPIRDKNNQIIEIACLAHDVTENKRFEKQIIEQSAKLNAIFESTSHLIWTVNKQLEITSYNKNYFNLVKDNLSKKKIVSTTSFPVLFTINDPEKKKFWAEKYKLVLSGKPQTFIHKSTLKDNKIQYREIFLYPIFHNKEVVEVSAIAQDITERIENENKMLQQSAKLKAIFESGNQLMWTITEDHKITSFNQNYAKAIFDLYEFYPVAGKSIREISNNKTIFFEDVWNEKYKLAFSGKQVEFTTERIQKDKSKVYRQYYLYPIINHNNKVIEVSGLGFDITENKKNEEKISQSLKEKEVLLKEVHHRVKNNMQVISSILNLQSSYVKDVYALNLLKECQNRIKSMAFIHESLYQAKNFESVNFTEYLTTLSKNLVHSYTLNQKKIKLILSLDQLFLSIDTSIPCGLIINEIISNSLKYAFTDNRDGIIFVNLKKINNLVRIEVGDNGVGIDPNFDIKETQTLGLQLVDSLIEQINGTLVLNRTNGTKFIIEFNI